MITQASVTQQIFEERKKTINSILGRSGAKQSTSAVRNRTRTPNNRDNNKKTLEAVPQMNSDLIDHQTDENNTRA
jgi:hypothetical protein